jgi:hypothetical protein
MASLPRLADGKNLLRCESIISAKLFARFQVALERQRDAEVAQEALSAQLHFHRHPAGADLPALTSPEKGARAALPDARLSRPNAESSEASSAVLVTGGASASDSASETSHNEGSIGVDSEWDLAVASSEMAAARLIGTFLFSNLMARRYQVARRRTPAAVAKLEAALRGWVARREAAKRRAAATQTRRSQTLGPGAEERALRQERGRQLRERILSPVLGELSAAARACTCEA